jgi:hypothetical protein
MRLLKRWRSILFLLIVLGIGAMAMAYIRSPGYRAAQAFARIQKGMTFDDADKVLVEAGGYRNRFRMGIPVFDEMYSFGNGSVVGLNMHPDALQAEIPCVRDKFLRRPTFTEWVGDLIESFIPTTIVDDGAGFANDANERMQELLNESENLAQISDEWQRFWQIEQPARPKE